jgi:hypothetical protein
LESATTQQFAVEPDGRPREDVTVATQIGTSLPVVKNDPSAHRVERAPGA